MQRGNTDPNTLGSGISDCPDPTSWDSNTGIYKPVHSRAVKLFSVELKEDRQANVRWCVQQMALLGSSVIVGSLGHITVTTVCHFLIKCHEQSTGTGPRTATRYMSFMRRMSLHDKLWAIHSK